MMTNMSLVEQMQVVPAVMPVNLSTAVNPGDWVDMRNFERCAIIFIGGAGTAGDDPIITLSQATDTNGTGSKPLSVITSVATKVATDVASVGKFTNNAQAAGNTFTGTGEAAFPKVWMLEVRAETLDINNGFICLQASLNKVGTNAQLGAMVYLLYGVRDITNIGGNSVGVPSALV